MQAYGGWVCACCSFDGTHLHSMMSLDHINNDGAAHIRSLGGRGNGVVWRDLVRRGFPEGFQVLCMNCNFSKKLNGGVCEHMLGMGK
jgi:hypothetical protein